MVRQPSVFLMDEPLSNLDAALRISMRAEIKQLHQAMQTTFVYVTHDQAEALTLADRIVVMRDGVVQQIGTPDEIYEQPRNKFVASFLGNPPINFLEGVVGATRDGPVFQCGDLRLALPDTLAAKARAQGDRAGRARPACGRRARADRIRRADVAWPGDHGAAGRIRPVPRPADRGRSGFPARGQGIAATTRATTSRCRW